MGTWNDDPGAQASFAPVSRRQPYDVWSERVNRLTEPDDDESDLAPFSQILVKSPLLVASGVPYVPSRSGPRDIAGRVSTATTYPSMIGSSVPTCHDRHNRVSRSEYYLAHLLVSIRQSASRQSASASPL